MKKFIWRTVIGIAVTILSTHAASFGQNQTSENHDWKLVKTNKKGEGWMVFEAKESNSKLRQFKIVGKVKCSVELAQATAMEMITDPTIRITKRGKSLGYVKVLEQTDDEMVVYDFMKGSTLVKDRDVVVRYSAYRDPATKSTGIKWTQIDREGYEPNDSVVRMLIARGSWRFEEIDAENCMATCSYQFHPGGNPPTWIINKVVKASIPIELEHLRKFVREQH